MPGTAAQAIAAGYHNGGGTVAGDADLAAGNIVSGVQIFGVTGTAPLPSGTAAASDVLIGKTFSNAAGTAIGGAMPDRGAVSLVPGATPQSIPAGYHNGSGTVAGDADLASGNIRSGVSIFGVPGDSNVVDTGSGDATAAAIQSGKKAWVDGAEVTGSMPTGALSPASATVSAGYYEATTLSAVDTDLAAGNIKQGVNLFGVTGTNPPAGSVPRTGQTVSTSATAGEDGDLQKGLAWPSPRFTDNGNGTVTDNLTGLIWLKNADCFGFVTTQVWATAPASPAA